MAHLHDLPEEILFHIAHFLPGTDVIAFSHTCQRFFYVLQNDHLWNRIFDKEKMVKDPDIFSYSNKVVNSSMAGSAVAKHYHPKEKMNYIQHRRIIRNWHQCRFKQYSMPLSEKSKVGHDTKTLVKIQQMKQSKLIISVYDLRQPGLHPVANSKVLDLELKVDRLFNLELCAILVAKSTAVLCFNGIGEDTPQEPIAIDLASPDFHELWRDVIHDWGQFQLMRLFGKDVYKFDLLNNTIETRDIRTYAKIHTLPLVEEMRYPHGEIAGDGRHLAVPG